MRLAEEEVRGMKPFSLIYIYTIDSKMKVKRTLCPSSQILNELCTQLRARNHVNGIQPQQKSRFAITWQFINLVHRLTCHDSENYPPASSRQN